MRDIHVHILPGVDDGARDMTESLDMLDVAAEAGVTEIVCTPHCREPYFDYQKMVATYNVFAREVVRHHPEIAVSLGWEVNLRTLRKIGFNTWAPRLGFVKPRPARGLETGQVHEFLLELPVRATADDYTGIERDIFALQGMGYEVIIAHPERYLAIREDITLARQLTDMGCLLQASGDFLTGGRLAGSRRPAKKMLKAGLYSFIASDAHNVGHYRVFDKAWNKYSKYLETE